MKLKLDENLGRTVAEIFSRRGYDVATVAGEQLTGASDRTLIDVCKCEHRCLVTLDLEFGNPLTFKPSQFPGIAVLRMPGKPGPEDLTAAAGTLATALSRSAIEGKLWIVQRGRVREYQEPGQEVL